ncbi:MAG: DUF58 domain-containing protein [Candidatus Bathyarchaeota archaeon]|nr:MAG: DUF58 domain-containing protein [Candidatus Bathyarchaeota archaeon]
MAPMAREAGLLLTGFTTIFFSGFLLANPILICASFIPIFIYFMRFSIAPPHVSVKKTGLSGSVRLNQIVEMRTTGEVTGGPGVAVIYDEIPEPFQLVEGTNFKVLSKWFGDKSFGLSYKIRCTKLGVYRLALGWETRHIVGLTRAQVSIEETGHLRVFPKAPRIRRMKLPLKRTQRIHPSEGIAKIGPLSTNFKEIRDYIYGDPFKSINWKASARATGRGKLYPMVNEYEREGKLSIWLFLDASPDLRVGTSFENALEYCVRAAYTISFYFLNKGYSLGMYIYNHQGETLHFDTGKKQFIRIADSLLRLTPETGLHVFWDEGFSKAVERNQKHIVPQSPAIGIITHVTSGNWNDLLNGLRQILIYKRRKREPNILLINALPYDLIPKVNDWEIHAAKMLDVTSRAFSNRLRNLGATVLDWNPARESIEATLLSTIWLR